MAATGLDAFDKTLHTTNLWLDEISEDIGPDRQLAWHVLGTVLRAIRDAVQVEQSAHLAAQLPLLVRGAYFDQYRPAAQPAAARSHDDFIARIRDDLDGSRPVNPEQAAAAVMGTLNRHVTAGQIKKVRDALPKGIRAIWPEPGHDDDHQAQPGATARQQPAPSEPASASTGDTSGDHRSSDRNQPARPRRASAAPPVAERRASPPASSRQPPAQPQQEAAPRHAAPPLSPASEPQHGPESSAHGRWEDIAEAEAEAEEAEAFLSSSPGKAQHVPIGAASRPAPPKLHAAPPDEPSGGGTPKKPRGRRQG